MKLHFPYLLILPVFVILVAISCNNKKTHSKIKSKKHYISLKQARKFIDEFFTHKFNKKLDVYVPETKLLQGDKENFRVSVYIRRKFSEESILMLFRTYVSSNSQIIADYKKIRGIVDEMYVVKLASNKKSKLILLKWHTLQRGFVTTHITFYDFYFGKLQKKWSIIDAYDREIKETYSPPEFHYWDGDDDGIRELILTNVWSKKQPPKWKFRWAIFKWSIAQRKFIPVKGLILNKYKDQNPLWLTFAFAEAIKYKKTQKINELMLASSPCDDLEDIFKLINLKIWKKFHSPIIEKYSENQAETSFELKDSKGDKYLMKLMLKHSIGIYYYHWKICKVRLFKLHID